jgi:hypothetical protein
MYISLAALQNVAWLMVVAIFGIIVIALCPDKPKGRGPWKKK